MDKKIWFDITTYCLIKCIKKIKLYNAKIPKGGSSKNMTTAENDSYTVFSRLWKILSRYLYIHNNNNNIYYFYSATHQYNCKLLCVLHIHLHKIHDI